MPEIKRYHQMVTVYQLVSDAYQQHNDEDYPARDIVYINVNLSIKDIHELLYLFENIVVLCEGLPRIDMLKTRYRISSLFDDIYRCYVRLDDNDKFRVNWFEFFKITLPYNTDYVKATIHKRHMATLFKLYDDDEHFTKSYNKFKLLGYRNHEYTD